MGSNCVSKPNAIQEATVLYYASVEKLITITISVATFLIVQINWAQVYKKPIVLRQQGNSSVILNQYLPMNRWI